MRRQREVGNAEPYKGTWTLRNITGNSFKVTHTSIIETKYSLMADGIHGEGRPDSACSHFKYLTSAPAYAQPVNPIELGIGGNSVDINPPSGRIPLHSGMLPGIPESITTTKFNRFLLDAQREFTEQFNEEVSLANFVIELKDFRSAIDEAKKLFSFRQGGGFFKSLQSFLHGRAKNGVGGNILDFELNWKSLIGDIPKIWNAYSVAMKRLEFLVGHQQFHTHKRTRFLYDESSEVKVFSLVPDVVASFPAAYEVWLVPSQFQVIYNATAFIDNHLQLEDISTWWALADTLGLNNPVRIAWNAVKLSWVADMFVETEEFLDAFEKEAYNGVLVNRGGCASYKVIRFYDVVCRWSNSDLGMDESVVGSIRVTDYDRVVSHTIRPSLLSLQDGLNAHQTYLLTALGDAQLGITSGGYEKISRLAADFRRNKRNFGRRYWKRGKR